MTTDTGQRAENPRPQRFSKGIDELPDTQEKRLTGCFGIEQFTGTAEKRALGRSGAGIEDDGE